MRHPCSNAFELILNDLFDLAAMIPILLYILYKKKGKDISRAAKKVLSKAKTKRMLKKAENMLEYNVGNKRKPIRNVYRKFRNRRFNRKRTRN